MARRDQFEARIGIEETFAGVFRQRYVETDYALLAQFERSVCEDRFAHGTGLENGFVVHARPRRGVFEAESPAPCDFRVGHHRERKAGNTEFGHQLRQLRFEFADDLAQTRITPSDAQRLVSASSERKERGAIQKSSAVHAVSARGERLKRPQSGRRCEDWKQKSEGVTPLAELNGAPQVFSRLFAFEASEQPPQGALPERRARKDKCSPPRTRR